MKKPSEEQKVEKDEKEDHKDWTTGLLEKRLGRDKLDRQRLDGLKMTDGSKRKNNQTKTRRKPKRRKYDMISEDWGLGGSDRVLSSGIEGAIKKPNSETVASNIVENVESVEGLNWYVKNVVEKPKAIEWDVMRLTILALEWEGQQLWGEHAYTSPPPVGRK